MATNHDQLKQIEGQWDELIRRPDSLPVGVSE
jgi:hypothetical protein